MSRFTTRCSTDHRRLSDLRATATDWLRDELADRSLPEHVVVDVDVVMTELAANVIDHTVSPWVQVAVDVGLDVIAVEVTSPSSVHDVPPAECWGLLEEGDRGRGLRMVRALSRQIELTGDSERTSVRCEIALS